MTEQSDITFRSGQVQELPLTLGAPFASYDREMVVPVSVAGGTLEIVVYGPEYLSCWPHVEQINGVPYDVAWSMERDDPRQPNAWHGGWRSSGFRVQRVDSNTPRDRTDAAALAVSRLMRRITAAIADDEELMRRAGIVAAERVVRDKDIRFSAALRELETAERELMQAEEALHALTGGDLTLVSAETRKALGAGGDAE